MSPLSQQDRDRAIAVASQSVAPVNGFERHFLRVVQGLARPASPLECAWFNCWIEHQTSKATSPSLNLPVPIQQVPVRKRTEGRRRPKKPSTAPATRLHEELSHALMKTEATELAAWGAEVAAIFAEGASRRVETLGRLMLNLGAGTWQEVCAAFDAVCEGRTRTYVVGIADRASEAGEELARGATEVFRRLQHVYESDPQLGATRALAIVLGAFAGSGGPDGNGGAPDLDLVMGIDAHRSVLTHSILAGIVVETSALALVSLVRRIHAKLPENHDAFWDNVLTHADAIADGFSRGTSAGIAYHLFIDSSVQAAPYKDLPFSAPLEAHQFIMAASATAEAADAAGRPAPGESRPRTQAGQLVDDGIGAVQEAADYVTDYVRGFWAGLTSSR